MLFPTFVIDDLARRVQKPSAIVSLMGTEKSFEKVRASHFKSSLSETCRH